MSVSVSVNALRRRPDAGWVDPRDLPKGPNGRALCRQCGAETRPPRRTFCGEECVHRWLLTTDPAYLRRRVFERDRGVCSMCGLDTRALELELGGLRGPALQRRSRQIRLKLGLTGKRIRHFWEADHITPVAQGGGRCGMENLRTLCLPCHRRSTRELRHRTGAAS